MKFTLMILFLLLVPITLAYFEESQCDCPGNGLEVSSARIQGNLLKCQYRPAEYDDRDIPKIYVEVWTYIQDYEMSKAINYTKKHFKDDQNDKNFNHDYDLYFIEENRVGYVSYVTDSVAPGERRGNIKNSYKGYDIGIGTSGFHEDVSDKMLATEKCMMEAVDLHIKRQEEILADKDKLYFSIDGRPLKKLRVDQNYATYFADDNGMLVLQDEIDDFDIVFQHGYDFMISAGDNPTLKIEIDVEDRKIVEIVAVISDDEEKELKIVNPNLLEFDIEDYNDQIGYYTYNYMYFQDAFDYYVKKGVEFKEGLKILLGVNYDKGAGYENGKIIMNGQYMDPNNKFTPYTQYHEFSHYVMHTIYGEVYDEMVKEKNHGGFANPSTADSWAEGFAEFMPTQIAQFVDFYWATEPSQRNPAIYPPAGSLDANYKAWDAEGLAEEYAIAGMLWDFVDDAGMDELALMGADIAFLSYIKSADKNDDKVITKEEFTYEQFFEGGASIEMDYANWLSMIPYGVTLKNSFDVQANMSIFDKYKGDDEELTGDELIEMADIMNYEFKSDIAKEWLKTHDDDENGIISKAEARNILKGYEIIKFISKGEEEIDKTDWKKLSKDKKIQDGTWVFGNKESITYEEYTNKLKDGAITDDDDEFSMDFDELWSFMITPHKDLTSFLEDVLEERDVLTSKKIALIFLKHGIYADLTEGNKKYDIGEAFVDTNNDQKRQETETFIDYPTMWLFDGNDDFSAPTNYERPDRSSPLMLPAQTVGGATQVSYIVWDKGRIKQAYTIQTDGYVPVPPDAQIFAGNEKETIMFSSEAFENDLEKIKERGNIAQIKASSTKTNSINLDEPEKSNKFWLYVLIAIVIIVVYMKKKKK